MMIEQRAGKGGAPKIVPAAKYGAAMNESTMRRALFLDRDGVINREVGYLHRAEEVQFVDGIFSLCRTAMGLGYRIIIVTNQSGIARGYYSVAQFDGLMDWMRMKFRAEKVEIDAVYFCPYHPEHGVGGVQTRACGSQARVTECSCVAPKSLGSRLRNR